MPASIPGAVELSPLGGEAGTSRIRWGPSSLLAVASWDKTLRIWSVRNASEPPELKKSFFLAGVGPLLDMCWDSDGAVLAGSCDGSLVSIDAETGVATDCGFHEAPIRTVHWVESIGAALTGGWDNCFRAFDPRSGKPATTVALGSRVHAADYGLSTYVVSTADLRLHIFDIRKLGVAVRETDSPFIQQSRALRLFSNAKMFAVTGMEGRCGIRCVSEDEDTEKIKGGDKLRFSFTFKCHRNGDKIYPVHAIDTHPDKADVFATVGGDGLLNIWEKGERVRLREFKSPRPGAQQPMTDVSWNPEGNLLAWAEGYDWAYGEEKAPRPGAPPPKVWVMATPAPLLTKK